MSGRSVSNDSNDAGGGGGFWPRIGMGTGTGMSDGIPDLKIGRGIGMGKSDVICFLICLI